MLVRHARLVPGIYPRTLRPPQVKLHWIPRNLVPLNATLYLSQSTRHYSTNSNDAALENARAKVAQQQQELLKKDLRVLRDIRQLRSELQQLRVKLDFPNANKINLYKHVGKTQARVLDLDNPKVKLVARETEVIRDAFRSRILKSLAYQPEEEHYVKAIVYDIVDEIRNPELRHEIFERTQKLTQNLGEMDKSEIALLCDLIKLEARHVHALSFNNADFSKVLELAQLGLRRLRERPAITELVEKELGLKHRPKTLPGPKVDLSPELINSAIRALEDMGMDKQKAAAVLQTLREGTAKATSVPSSPSTTSTTTSPTATPPVASKDATSATTPTSTTASTTSTPTTTSPTDSTSPTTPSALSSPTNSASPTSSTDSPSTPTNLQQSTSQETEKESPEHTKTKEAQPTDTTSQPTSTNLISQENPTNSKESTQINQTTDTNQVTQSSDTTPAQQNVTQASETTQINDTTKLNQTTKADETNSSTQTQTTNLPAQTNLTSNSQEQSTKTPTASQTTSTQTTTSSQTTTPKTGQTTTTSPSPTVTPKPSLAAVMPDIRRENEQILDVVPRFPAADYAPIPLIPWLVETEQLTTMAKEHFREDVYKSPLTKFWNQIRLWRQTGIYVTESKLLKMAKIALQSFVGAVEEQDLDSLSKMVSKPLFEHVKSALKAYKEHRISVHFDKLDIVDSKLLFLDPHYLFNSKYVKHVSLVPFEGPSLGETRSMLRHYLRWGKSIYIQNPYRDGVDNSAYSTLKEMDNEAEIKQVVTKMKRIKRDDVQLLLTFGVLIRANEVYFVRDNKTGQVIDGSRSEKQFIHFLKFASPLLGPPMWKIYDMQDFNKTEGLSTFLDMKADESILMEPQNKVY